MRMNSVCPRMCMWRNDADGSLDLSRWEESNLAWTFPTTSNCPVPNVIVFRFVFFSQKEMPDLLWKCNLCSKAMRRKNIYSHLRVVHFYSEEQIEAIKVEEKFGNQELLAKHCGD
ncbi:hypothetical protein V3C99_007795 [Haemonchus contortus]